MKHIYLNLKRFDIPAQMGGVNSLAPITDWGGAIVERTQEALRAYGPTEADFTMYFPEAHLIGAFRALSADSPVKLGCQSVYREDTAPGGNFGAFTSNRPAAAAKALGCQSVIIGHCEERNAKTGLLSLAGVPAPQAAAAVNSVLNMEVRAAQARGLHVLYCIGENSEEQPRWQQVLGQQLDIGLQGADMSRVTIAYEPVWSIGPGKTPAGKQYITMVARFIKEHTGGSTPVVYGGGLKADNAAMLSSIPEVDGGLIALTRFSGDIGFYPEEYLEIIRLYLGK